VAQLSRYKFIAILYVVHLVHSLILTDYGLKMKAKACRQKSVVCSKRNILCCQGWPVMLAVSDQSQCTVFWL